jgi:SNF2 family DNA or RNA helicase
MDTSKITWRFTSTPESKKLLLLYWQNGLIQPNEAARKELQETMDLPRLHAEVKQIKKEEKTSVEVPLKIELFQHQKKAFSIGTTLAKVGLLMEQGTGKTLSSLAIAGYRYKKGEIKRLLIVAPKSTLKPWEEEILNYVDFPVEIINLVNTKGSKKSQILSKTTRTESLQIVLISYQSVWRVFEDLVKWKPGMIIADEMQKIKNGGAKQSKAMHKLGDLTKYKQGLTGTPVTQGPMDIWSEYRYLDSDVFGRSFSKFRGQYAIMGGFKGYQIVKYQNLDELSEKAHSISYRVRKEDTDIDLPPITNQYLYCEIERQTRKYYREMEKEFKVTLKENGGNAHAPIVLTQLLRLQQLVGGFIPTEEGEIVKVDNSKLALLQELVEDLPVDKKLVVFARFLPEIDAMKEMLTKMGRGVVTLTGATKDRGGAINIFTKDPTTTIMVAQIQTGGVGLNLQVADTIIFYSTNFSYGDYDQAKARIHRIGQKSKSVTYIHLVAENTVDEKIFRALEAKKDVATYIVDHPI